MPKTYKGVSDTDSVKEQAKESVVQGGPSYDSRPRPKNSPGVGPTAPGIYKDVKGK